MASQSSTMSLAAGFLVLALASPAFAEHYIEVYEGISPGSEAVVGRPSGILLYDRLLGRLPGAAKISGDSLLDGPLFIQVPRADGHLATYFAAKGLGSVLSEPVFRLFRDSLLKSEQKEKTYALVYRPETYKDPRLLETSANELYVPDDFKVGDLMAVLFRNQQIPSLLIGGEDYFRKLNLDGSEQKYVGLIRLFVEQRSVFIKP